MSTDNTLSKGHHYAHHFRDAEHEFNTSKFGVWIFLATEILMFGGLLWDTLSFKVFIPKFFKAGATHLDWRLGALNTIVLLVSSFTMAMAIYSAQQNKAKAVVRYLIITSICAVIFMVVKYFEYTHKFHLGIFPGEMLTYENPFWKAFGTYFFHFIFV